MSLVLEIPDMPVNRTVPFADLGRSDLIVDALYKGGDLKHAGDDPISKLIGTGNQGGFRYTGSLSDRLNLCALYSENSDPDWPDSLNYELGLFTYYGDNKNPGRDIHDTIKRGNQVLQRTFEQLHLGNRASSPPFFVFTKGGTGRDVIFRGLAVPGGDGISSNEDLVAIWKIKNKNRFANYRAVFTILDVARVPRAWLDDLVAGLDNLEHAPMSWREWKKTGKYRSLRATPSKRYRERAEQLPSSPVDCSLLESLIGFFKVHPRREYAFEGCAVELVKMMDRNFISFELTRPWRDGGRDAIGEYRIGLDNSAIMIDCALEAKCNAPTTGSGVKEVSRLIARLKYRQFGIFVTTSYVGQQAYREIIEDGHPVMVLSGVDIVNILYRGGYGEKHRLINWLNNNFCDPTK